MTIKIKTTLKNLLNENDMTAAQLSRATKIAPQTINNWFAGQEPRNLSQLKTVADYFNISLDELLYGRKNKITKEPLKDFSDEINAGVFEVVLRKVQK